VPIEDVRRSGENNRFRPARFAGKEFACSLPRR